MASHQALKECTVFIVEDSQIIVGRVHELLADMDGIRFLGNAASITAALEILSCETPDVMILDINLGSAYPVNGIQFLSMVRKVYPELTIIMFTNHTDQHYRKMCMEGGADFFFDKSNDYDKIPETLDVMLRLKNET